MQIIAIIFLIVLICGYIWLYKSESENQTMEFPGGLSFPEHVKFIGVIFLIFLIIFILTSLAG